LRPYEGGLNLDEVQIVPDLFRFLKTLAVEARLADVDFILEHSNGSLSSIESKPEMPSQGRTFMAYESCTSKQELILCAGLCCIGAQKPSHLVIVCGPSRLMQCGCNYRERFGKSGDGIMPGYI
jgi:hypothetical protein